MEPQSRPGERPFLARRLAESTELLDRVEAAERLGISLRRFEGWEPRTFHIHQDGQLVESVREAEWDDQEQAWMLALEMYRKSRCGNCGGDLAETTDAAHDGRYVPQLPVQCHRCDGLMSSQEQYREHPRPLSLMHRVELRRG